MNVDVYLFPPGSQGFTDPAAAVELRATRRVQRASRSPAAVLWIADYKLSAAKTLCSSISARDFSLR
jgi:hypothetical protein